MKGFKETLNENKKMGTIEKSKTDNFDMKFINKFKLKPNFYNDDFDFSMSDQFEYLNDEIDKFVKQNKHSLVGDFHNSIHKKTKKGKEILIKFEDNRGKLLAVWLYTMPKKLDVMKF